MQRGTYTLKKISRIETQQFELDYYFIEADTAENYNEAGNTLVILTMDGKENEFTNSGIDHLYSNISDCGLPAYVADVLVIESRDILSHLRNNEKEWRKLAKKTFKKSEVESMDFHDFVYHYSRFKERCTYTLSLVKKSLKKK